MLANVSVREEQTHGKGEGGRKKIRSRTSIDVRAGGGGVRLLSVGE